MKNKLLVYIALLIDVLIAVTKFIASAITGSSAMRAEGIHSVIDAVSQVLLLVGLKKSRKRADGQRPFGYGREIFFWSFIVSLVIFVIGGCVSFYEGWIRMKQPAPDGHPGINYLILIISFAFISVPAWLSLRDFNRERKGEPFWKSFRQSKNPTVFITLLSDIGDLLGILIAFAGVYFSHLYHNALYDGVASMLIGLILIIISAMLVMESKSLLMGEPIGRVTLKEIIDLTEKDEAIVKVKKHFSIYLAPEEVVLQMVAVFHKNLSTKEITGSIERISALLQKKYPRIKQIFIEPAV